jgi:hypothetical protein
VALQNTGDYRFSKLLPTGGALVFSRLPDKVLTIVHSFDEDSL